jgi:hypothetical protein
LERLVDELKAKNIELEAKIHEVSEIAANELQYAKEIYRN